MDITCRNLTAQRLAEEANPRLKAERELADLLGQARYAGLTGQISSHGCERFSVQIFAPVDDPRFLGGEVNAQGYKVVLDYDV